MIKIRLLGTMLVATLIAACSGVDLLDLSGPDELRIDDVRVTLSVTPDVIDSPGTAIARLTYENLSDETVELVSSAGCLSFSAVYRGDDRIPFPSTQYVCTAALSSRDLVPGNPIVVEWPLVVGGDDGLHVPTGTYRFVADLNTGGGDLEQTFVVR